MRVLYSGRVKNSPGLVLAAQARAAGWPLVDGGVAEGQTMGATARARASGTEAAAARTEGGVAEGVGQGGPHVMRVLT